MTNARNLANIARLTLWPLATASTCLLPFGFIPALLAVVVAAVGKEVWDAQGHGTPDRMDALATVAGGVL